MRDVKLTPRKESSEIEEELTSPSHNESEQVEKAPVVDQEMLKEQYPINEASASVFDIDKIEEAPEE